jgi:hypothetical protein
LKGEDEAYVAAAASGAMHVTAGGNKGKPHSPSLVPLPAFFEDYQARFDPRHGR